MPPWTGHLALPHCSQPQTQVLPRNLLWSEYGGSFTALWLCMSFHLLEMLTPKFPFFPQNENPHSAFKPQLMGWFLGDTTHKVISDCGTWFKPLLSNLLHQEYYPDTHLSSPAVWEGPFLHSLHHHCLAHDESQKIVVAEMNEQYPHVYSWRLHLYSCPATRFTHFSSFHIYALICNTFLSFWLTSLSMPWSIHISTNDPTSFLKKMKVWTQGRGSCE